jgi:hypothetical protein
MLNKKLLPVVKQLANDSMLNNAMIKFFVCLHGDKIYNSFVIESFPIINLRGVSTNKTIIMP